MAVAMGASWDAWRSSPPRAVASQVPSRARENWPQEAPLGRKNSAYSGPVGNSFGEETAMGTPPLRLVSRWPCLFGGRERAGTLARRLILEGQEVATMAQAHHFLRPGGAAFAEPPRLPPPDFPFRSLVLSEPHSRARGLFGGLGTSMTLHTLLVLAVVI